MLTPEQRAEISRENGAKSRGPVTDAGKARSSRNAIRHGRYANALSLFVPPHEAVIASEDRAAFYARVERALQQYRPTTDIELDIVRKIVECEWKISRHSVLETAFLNRELLRHHATVDVTHELLAEVDVMMTAFESTANSAALRTIRRESSRLARLIAEFERRLIRLRKEFPSSATRVPDLAVDRMACLDPSTYFDKQPTDAATRDFASEDAIRHRPNLRIPPTAAAEAYSLLFLKEWKEDMEYYQRQYREREKLWQQEDAEQQPSTPAEVGNEPGERTQPESPEATENTQDPHQNSANWIEFPQPVPASPASPVARPEQKSDSLRPDKPAA